MGLDMYLTARKFHTYASEDKIDELRIKEISFEVAYWRKHPNLHGYIVQNFAGGVDECQEIDLSIEQMEQIIAAVKARELPPTGGFFFGSSTNAESSQQEIDDEVQEDVAAFEKAIDWLKAHPSTDKHWNSIEYRASW